jgi:hypothetical protein
MLLCNLRQIFKNISDQMNEEQEWEFWNDSDNNYARKYILRISKFIFTSAGVKF